MNNTSQKGFDYRVSTTADNQAFYSACEKIEKLIPEIRKKNLLIDVDGSLVQEYITNHGIIIVQNDYEVDAVYIESEINLDGLVYESIQ